jgi:hypothetical protein
MDKLTDALTFTLTDDAPKSPGHTRQVSDDAASNRARLIQLFWNERLLPEHRQALKLSAPDNALRAADGWKNVFWFLFVPPTGVLHVFGPVGAKWRAYGAGIPFYLEGNLDEYGYRSIFVGWGAGFISVDVLLKPGENAAGVFQAFPGDKPESPIAQGF